MQAEIETLWPYKGFTVRARERRLGEGKLTLTEQSLLFEGNDGATVGFDFPMLRLVRLADVHTVELAYSIQGELRGTSFRVVCTFGGGTERDELPSRDDPYHMSILRAITGGVVARFLTDHTNARVEGLTKIAEDKFEARIKDLERNISLFPDKKQYDDDVWWDDDLHKRSLEAAKSEPEIWDDPYRDKLFYTGEDPSMNVDNAFEKFDILQDDWANGRLTPLQRARCVAMNYRIDMRMYEMGYNYEQTESPDGWREGAERIVQFEERLGQDVLRFTKS